MVDEPSRLDPFFSLALEFHRMTNGWQMGDKWNGYHRNHRGLLQHNSSWYEASLCDPSVMLSWFDPQSMPVRFWQKAYHVSLTFSANPMHPTEKKKKSSRLPFPFTLHFPLSYHISQDPLLFFFFFFTCLLTFFTDKFLCIQTEIGRPCFLFLQKRVKNL